MKKLLSVFLAALMLCGVFSVAVWAEDDASYTPVYSVSVSGWNAGQIEITPAEGYGEYVEAGKDFKFTVTTVNGYAFDQTTVIKVLPARTYGPDFVLTNLDVGYDEVLTPDENGVYTVDRVAEDLIVVAYNLEHGSLPGVKDMVLNLLKFFLRLFQWFFGLKKDA